MTKWAPSITHRLLSFSRSWVTLRHSTVAYFSSFFCAWSCLEIGMMSLNTKWSIFRCWVTDSQPWSRVGQRQELLFWRRVTHSLFGGPSSHLCFLQSGNLCVEDQLNVQLVPSSWPSLVPSLLGHYTSSIRFFSGGRVEWGVVECSTLPFPCLLEGHGHYDLPSEHLNWRRCQTSCR